VLDALSWRAEGFSCSLDVLYGCLGISILQFLIKIISSFLFQLEIFSNPGSRSVFSAKCWIRNRTQLIRFRNTDGNFSVSVFCLLRYIYRLKYAVCANNCTSTLFSTGTLRLKSASVTLRFPYYFIPKKSCILTSFFYSSPYKKQKFHQLGTVLGTRLIDFQIYLCSKRFGKE